MTSRRYTYSVCVATYNGEKYIKEQLDSILLQMTENDEVVVSDDGSKDNTIAVVTELQREYPNIKIVKGPQKGFSCNFENAVLNATKDIIVFSDQDDIWKQNKINRIDEVFSADDSCTTILHTMSTFRKGEEEQHEIPMGYHQGVCRNWLMSSYWGCCMAVKREFMLQFLPLRQYCVGHDQLTGLMTERYGKVEFINEDLIMHRLHDRNTSFTQPLIKKLQFRKNILKDYLFAKKTYKMKRKND